MKNKWFSASEDIVYPTGMIIPRRPRAAFMPRVFTGLSYLHSRDDKAVAGRWRLKAPEPQSTGKFQAGSASI
jgi:hypothetical protein